VYEPQEQPEAPDWNEGKQEQTVELNVTPKVKGRTRQLTQAEFKRMNPLDALQVTVARSRDVFSDSIFSGLKNLVSGLERILFLLIL
jgi:hypothetical protein